MRIAPASRPVWKLAVCRTYVARAYVSNNIFHVRHRCKLKLIYNSGSPTRHDFVLAAKQTPPSPDYVTFPREQLCETSGPGANRSDTFHTFHSIFNIHRCIPEVWSYCYPPQRERETRQHECTCSCCANRAFHSLSKSFSLMTCIVIFGIVSRDFLFRMVKIVLS